MKTHINWILCSEKMPKTRPNATAWKHSDRIFATDGANVVTGQFLTLGHRRLTPKDFCADGRNEEFKRIKAWSPIPEVRLEKLKRRE